MTVEVQSLALPWLTWLSLVFPALPKFVHQGEAMVCLALNWWLASLPCHDLTMKEKKRLALSFLLLLMSLAVVGLSKECQVFPCLTWTFHGLAIEGSQALPGLTLPCLRIRKANHCLCALACFYSLTLPCFSCITMAWAWSGKQALPYFVLPCIPLVWLSLWSETVSLFPSLPLALLWRGSQALDFLAVVCLSKSWLWVEAEFTLPCPALPSLPRDCQNEA